MAKKAAAAVAGASIKVRAIAVGFYGDVRRRIGDVFTLYPREGTFTELELDDKTGKPLLNEEALVKHRLTKEVEGKVLTAESQFNKKWMVKVPANTPEIAHSARDVLQQQHDAINTARLAGQADPDAGAATGDDDVLGNQ